MSKVQIITVVVELTIFLFVCWQLVPAIKETKAITYRTVRHIKRNVAARIRLKAIRKAVGAA